MITLIVILGVLAAAATVAAFFVHRQHPEHAASHSDALPSSTSEQLYKGADRPAGPDAETMDPDELGNHPTE